MPSIISIAVKGYRRKRSHSISALGLLEALLSVAVLTSACSSTSTAAKLMASPSASKAPITIGFDNQQLGAVSFPDFGAGAQAARQYINAHGGIDGHPLNFVNCYTDGTTSASVTCADRFVGASVPVVLEGIDEGSDAAVPILAGAGLPLVGHTAFGPVQSNSPDAFFFGAATGAYDAVPLVVMAKDLHIKTLTYIVASGPVDESYVTADLDPVSKALHLKPTVDYYNASSPNFTSVAAGAIASHPGALFFIGTDPGCTSFVSAVSSLAYSGYTFAGSCTAFATADGQAANGVFMSTDLYLPGTSSGVPTMVAAEEKTYVAAMRKYYPTYVFDAFAEDTFSSTMDLVNVLKSIHGRIYKASVGAALRSIRDMPSFLGQNLDCNGKQWPGESSACASGLVTYRANNGKLTPFTKGFVSAQQYITSAS